MKKLQDLTLFDKFLFDETMDIPEAHEAVLQIILGDLVKRSRFYQGQIDSSLLAPGDTSFNLMKDTCIIMITPFDLFGKGKYCYTFRARCEEDSSLLLEDGTVRIFLNSHGTNPEEVSEELVEFLKYMENTDTSFAENSKNDKIKKIHKYVNQIKASEEMGVKYMQKWEERVLDREEGRAAGEIYIIRNQIAKRHKNAEEISEILGLSLEYVQRVVRLIEEYPKESDIQIAGRVLKY